MLDLDTGVDLDEIVPAHLVHQELCGTGVPVTDALCQLNGVAQNSLTDLLREVSGGCDLNNLLVTPLHGTVTLKEMDGVALGISKELHLDVTRTLEESLDEDCAVAERRLGLAHGALEGVLEIGHFAYDTHTAASTTHSGLDDD